MCRLIFHWLVTKPVMLLIIGLTVRGRDRLPRRGPAIIVANHNSHADTVALLSLFPSRMLRRVRPVAAADYFLRNRMMAWIARHCIGILPFDRHALRHGRDPLTGCVAALDRGEILILFPEGSRGEPELPQRFKKGIYHLALRRPDVPIIPVRLRGLGRVLPKGAVIPLPLCCDAVVGPPLAHRPSDADEFIAALEAAMAGLGSLLDGPADGPQVIAERQRRGEPALGKVGVEPHLAAQRGAGPDPLGLASLGVPNGLGERETCLHSLAPTNRTSGDRDGTQPHPRAIRTVRWNATTTVNSGEAG